MTLFSKIALRNLWKNKRRSFSTGMAILAGFSGLSLLGGYLMRVEKYARVNTAYINHNGHLAIYKKDGLESFYQNPRKYHLKGEEIQQIQKLLKNEKEIEFAAPILKGMGLLSNGNKSVPFLAYGVDPEMEWRIRNHQQVQMWTKELLPSAGELSFSGEKNNPPDTISITRQLGSLIGRKPPFSDLSDADKDVQLAARSYEGDLNAVNATLGFKHTTGFSMLEDTGLVAPLSLLQDLYATDGATYLAVYLQPEASIRSVLKKVQQSLTRENINAEAFPFNDERISLFYSGTMGFLYIMTGFFVFLIFGAVALSIVNSITIGILERVREVGTLRAIGYTNSQTAWIFTLENIYLTSISLGVGYVVTQITAVIVNALNLRFYPPGISGDMQFILTPTFWICLVVAVPILIICSSCAYLVSKKLVAKPIIQLLQQAN